MAYEVPVLDYSFTMNVSSTAKQFYIVKHTTAANTVTLTTAAGERAIGIIQEPTSSGGTAPVMLYGISKVAQDGSLNPGDQFQCSAAGLATAASTAVGIYRLGTCVESGSTVSGTIVTVILWPNGQSTN